MSESRLAEGVGTGAGGGDDPASIEATSWVNRSTNCPEASAQAHLFGEEVSEHFPWHYTEFGVICSCGRPMRNDETCPAETESQAGSEPTS